MGGVGMKVLVAGVGGIGGFLGAKLASAYSSSGSHEVYFLARGPHLDAIKKNGLTLRSPLGTITAHPKGASDAVSLWPEMDLVILCVKGYDLRETAKGIEPVVGENTLVLPLQNGIGKRGEVEKVLARGQVADGTMYVFAHIHSPGVVVHVGGPGKVVFGSPRPDLEPKLEETRDLLCGAQIEADLTTEVEVAIWKKFLVLAPVAGLTALYGATVGEVRDDQGKWNLLLRLMEEVVELAKASGVSLGGDALDEAVAIVRSFPRDGKSSLLHDLEAGRKNELDWLLGRALDLGRDLGISLPFLKEVYDGIRSRWSPGRFQ
jgi:2-dehydropantoate 2-reductase